MKFFLDENMPLSVVDAIRNIGFEAEHVKTVGLQGSTDKEIANHARKNNAILVTKDLEFGGRTLYPKGSHYGLLVLRLPHFFTARQIIEAITNFLTEVRPEILENAVVVLELGRYRMRKLS